MTDVQIFEIRMILERDEYPDMNGLGLRRFTSSLEKSMFISLPVKSFPAILNVRNCRQPDIAAANL